MEFKQVDGSARFSKIMKKEYEVAAQGWTASFFPSPEGTMHSKFADEVEVTNITSMGYPELDELINQYNAEWSAKKRIPIAHQIDSIAVNSYHYALGWTNPYGARMLYWNKFDMPKSGITYVGDWRTPMSHWWVDSSKEAKLNSAIENNEKLPIAPEMIDYWNRMK
jgi:ABC-type oligopeptide transport system substrate-binding subunit